MKSIRIGWWNTGYAPPTTKECVGKRGFDDAVEIIKKLLIDEQIGILGLCEVNAGFFIEPTFSTWLSSNGFSWDSVCHHEANLVWDIGIIYKDSEVKNDRCIIVDQLKESLEHKKTAIKWELKLWETPIDIYVSHFAQSSTTPDIKQDLVSRIITSMIDGPGGADSIAMGDYNIQLCEQNLFNKISKSRKAKPNQVYSPFWKYCSEKYKQSDSKTLSGTKLHDNQWLLIDYFFYHRNFTDMKYEWFCDEDQFGILDDIADQAKLFSDHIPVYITLRKPE